MKKIIAIILCLSLNIACAVPTHHDGPSAEHGFSSAFLGIAHLILSPIQIAAGLLEGIASMPYYLSTNIHEINRGMIDAQASITLDDTYDSAYGKRLNQVPETGDTGEVFRRMKHATNYFHKVLKGYGVRDADRYILTSIDTATSEGYTLFAVVYRPLDTITVVDKYDSNYTRTFHKKDRLFYEPFKNDITGRPLDTIVDWAGLPKEFTKTQKAQAILITMAANAVVDGRKSQDYWEAERRWIAGEFKEITEDKMNGVKLRMKI